MTKSLKREETARKVNDDEAEKLKRRGSAKLLGQQSTTRPGPAVNGFHVGKRPVQLNSAAAPTINVPRDAMNSNFGNRVKMAMENVSIRIVLQAQISSCPSVTNMPTFESFLAENQCEQLLVLPLNRLFT